MSNQLMPGSRKSGDFLAIAGLFGATFLNEGLEFAGLPSLSLENLIILAVGAITYAGFVTIQRVKGVKVNESMAAAVAEMAQGSVANMLDGNKKVESEAKVDAVEPAVQATQPVEQIFSDSLSEEPIPVNFAPVEKVVN